jgi:hypothetical protein
MSSVSRLACCFSEGFLSVALTRPDNLVRRHIREGFEVRVRRYSTRTILFSVLGYELGRDIGLSCWCMLREELVIIFADLGSANSAAPH